MPLFSYPSVQACVLGAQKNRLIETVLLSTHNICFDWEIRKLFSFTHSYLGVCTIPLSRWLVCIWCNKIPAVSYHVTRTKYLNRKSLIKQNSFRLPFSNKHSFVKFCWKNEHRKRPPAGMNILSQDRVKNSLSITTKTCKETNSRRFFFCNALLFNL